MPNRGHAFETLLWTDRTRLPLVEAVLVLMQGAVKPIGVGGPRQTQVKDFAARLSCPFDDDLRRLAIDKPAAFVLLASLENINAPSLAAAVVQGATVLTVEPIAARFEDLHRPPVTPLRGDGAAARPGRIIHVPSFMRSQGWLSAADPQSVLGAARSLSLTASSSADGCSLFARLHEAWRIILELAPLPESIDCAIAVPLRELPGGLRELAGSMTAHARLPEGGAVLQLSEAPGEPEVASRGTSPTSSTATSAPPPVLACDRLLDITGEHGRLRVSDTGYQLFDRAGRLLDHRDPPPGTSPHHLADVIADHWLQLIDRPALITERPGESEPREAAALACCLACLLSARTGQPERPDRLLMTQAR